VCSLIFRAQNCHPVDITLLVKYILFIESSPCVLLSEKRRTVGSWTFAQKYIFEIACCKIPIIPILALVLVLFSVRDCQTVIEDYCYDFRSVNGD
jgi:hypothetical protein